MICAAGIWRRLNLMPKKLRAKYPIKKSSLTYKREFSLKIIFSVASKRTKMPLVISKGNRASCRTTFSHW